MARRGSAVAGALLGLLVGAIALALALRDVDPGALAAAFARAGVGTVLVGAVVHLGVQVVYALRWRLLLGRTDLSLGRTTGAVGLGYLANYTLPGRPGELIRAGVIRGIAGVPFALALASLLLEKVLDGGTILLSAFSFALLGPLPDWLRASALVGAGVFAIGAVLLGLAAVLRLGGGGPRDGLISHWKASLTRLLREVGEPVRNVARPKALAAVLLLGTLSWGLIVLQQGVLCLGVGIDVGPAGWLLLYAALGLASVVPGAPGYVGTYQLAAVLALGAFGIEREPAFAVATLYQLSRLLGSLAVGSWAISREGLTALRVYWTTDPGGRAPSRHTASSSPDSERSRPSG